jgi:superfamily II DNA or RNA helicase
VRKQVIAKLPTGYGKTLAAAGSYAVVRKRGLANRCLYVVPRRRQAMQAGEEIPRGLATFGVTTGSITIGEDPVQALRRHREGAVEVFVATVQSLVTGRGLSAVNELLQTGQWFIVIDEHHHYGNGGAWVERMMSLNYAARLAMSATPNRHDGTDFFPDPDVRETYYEASRAGYVKRMSLHAYQYSVDAITVDGRVIPFTTEQILKDVGSDKPEAIDQYMASKKMRWSPKYISPLVTFPLDRIIGLRADRGIKSQMIVQAMSCAHAKMVCEQVSALIPDNMSVDWVGTGPFGRLGPENDAVIERFCPNKNPMTGRREWKLDILVNVGMAGEGLDTTDVTEVVFLTPANLTISNYQIMGRGARAMPGMPLCHINVDTSSPMAGEDDKYNGAKVMQLFDEDVKIEISEEDEEAARGESEYTELPDDFQVVIVDVRLVDIRQEPMFAHTVATLRADSDLATVADELIEEKAERAVYQYINRANNESAVLAQKRDQLNTEVRKVAGLVLRRIAQSGVRPEKSLVGDICKRISGRKKSLFGAVETACDAELQAHRKWLKNLEHEILTAHGIEGVPQWLR